MFNFQIENIDFFSPHIHETHHPTVPEHSYSISTICFLILGLQDQSDLPSCLVWVKKSYCCLFRYVKKGEVVFTCIEGGGLEMGRGGDKKALEIKEYLS